MKSQEKNCTPGIKGCYRNVQGAGNVLDVIGKVTLESYNDSSVIEEELVNLFLRSGKPLLKFLSIEPANNANAEGIIECIKTALERIGILDFQKRIMGLNVDGASVNTGLHNGVGVLMKADSPWFQVIHCFNHCLELAIKDATLI